MDSHYQDVQERIKKLEELLSKIEIGTYKNFTVRDFSFVNLENLGKIRDGLLLLGGAIYVLGYLVWAVVAWRNNLGPLPVLQAQYFVAGLPIFLVYILMYISVRLLQRIAFKWVPVIFDKLSFHNQELVSNILVALNMCYTIFLVILGSRQKFDLQPGVLIAIIIIFVILNTISAPHIFSEKYLEGVKSSGLFEENSYYAYVRSIKRNRYHFFAQKLFTTYMAPFFMCVYLTTIFVDTYYLKIPQEFGGAKPRLAVLDLVKGKFSIPTLNEIVDSSKVQPNSDILPSRQVTIHFTGSSYLLIEKMDTTTTRKGILEIPRDAIVAIHWLKGMHDREKALVDTSRTKKK